MINLNNPFNHCDFCKPTDMFCDMCEKTGEDFIEFLLSEMPEFSLSKEEKDEFMKQAKKYPHIEVEVREMKNGRYHISLWELNEEEN